jgi:hypothetical protein
VTHLYNTSAFLARGECRTYIGGAEANTVAMYGQMTLEPDAQVQYFDECAPRPAKATPVDSNVMCLQHVVPHVTGRTLLPPAGAGLQENVIEFDQTAFLLGNYNMGFEPTAFAYIPKRCRVLTDSSAEPCSVMIFFHGCGGGGAPGVTDTYVKYAESNGIVLLYPRIMSHGHIPPNNVTDTYPNSWEVARGCWDGYGQLSPRYALQSAPHMRSVWAIVAHVTGSNKTTLPDEVCATHCGS